MNKPSRSQRRPARRPSSLPYLAIVAGVTVAAFFPALSAGFVNFDDDRVIVHNPYLRLPFADAWSWMWTTLFIGHYQPLTWWSLFIDAHVGGFRPFAFHLSNVLLQALAAVVLTIALVRLLRLVQTTRDAPPEAIWMAAAAAALFWSIHPLRVESVAWIAERRDPLSIVFWLLALHAYLRSIDPAAPVSQARTWYFWSCAALALSLLAKAWGMSFVLVLIVLDWALGRRAWRDKIPYAVLGAAAATIAWIAQHSAVDTMIPIARWGWLARALQACYGLVFYVWKTIVPTRLAVLYELPRDWHDAAPLFIASAIIVTLVAVAIAARVRQYRGLAAATAAYAITLAPVLGFAQSGPQLVADRYAYVASVPLVALLAAALVVAARRTGTRPLVAAGVVVLATCAALTWRQSGVWHDSASLWSDAIASGHPSYAAHLNYGQALRASGQLDAALAQYRLAVERRPDAGNGWYNFANALKDKGRIPECEEAYGRAIALLGDDDTLKVVARVTLGNVYFRQRRLDDAIAQYRAATHTLDGMPSAEMPPEPYLYLGMALSDRGDTSGAREALTVALRHPATRSRAEQELRRLK